MNINTNTAMSILTSIAMSIATSILMNTLTNTITSTAGATAFFGALSPARSSLSDSSLCRLRTKCCASFAFWCRI